MAQEFVDEGRCHSRRVGCVPQCVEVRTVLEQDEGTEAEHAGGGLQAAGEDTVCETCELLVRDLVAVFPYEHAEQAVAGVPPLLFDDTAQIVPGLGDRPEGGADTAEDVEPCYREPLEGVPFLVGNAQEFADHEGRDRHREVLHEVDRAVRPRRLGQRGELLFDYGVNPWREPAEPPHREFGGEQPPQVRVVRRVAETEAARLVVLVDPVSSYEVGEVVAEGARVAENLPRLVVTGDEPDRHAGDRKPADGLPVTQRAELGERVEALAAQRQEGVLGKLRERGEIQPAPLAPEPGEVAAGEPDRDGRTRRAGRTGGGGWDGPGW